MHISFSGVHSQPTSKTEQHCHASICTLLPAASIFAKSSTKPVSTASRRERAQAGYDHSQIWEFLCMVQATILLREMNDYQ